MKRSAARGLFFFLLVSIFSFNIADAGDQAQVETFSPQGSFKGVRQVSVRFSEPMVAFGDPRLPAPFEIACPVKGQARWADQRNWIFDFDEDLPAGVACELRLKPGLTAVSGKPVGGKHAFSFSTGGPAILQSAPYEGNTVSEDQAFILSLDAEADAPSVLACVFFSVDGIRDRVAVRIVNGDARKTILRSRRYARDDPLHLVIQPTQAFPPGAKIKLVWGKGVQSKSGVATEEAQTLSFKVRGPSTAHFSCVFEDGIELPRTEWFLAGTERDAVALAPATRAARIAYPAGGEIIVVDPDIPPERQEVFFEADGNTEGLSWTLDGEPLAPAGTASWKPRGGKHTVRIVDARGETVDEVAFVVRGAYPR